eukprot:2862180-Pyramimonas_sp.AAC.1
MDGSPARAIALVHRPSTTLDICNQTFGLTWNCSAALPDPHVEASKQRLVIRHIPQGYLQRGR